MVPYIGCDDYVGDPRPIWGSYQGPLVRFLIADGADAAWLEAHGAFISYVVALPIDQLHLGQL